MTGPIPEIPEVHAEALPILQRVAELQEVERHEVLETGGAVGHQAPVPEVGFRHALERGNAPAGEWPHERHVIQTLQHVNPVGHRPMAHFQVFPQRVQREWGANPAGQGVGELLDQGKVADGVEVADVLAEEPLEPAALPAPQGARRLGQQGLRKPAVLEERPEMTRRRVRRGANVEFPPGHEPARGVRRREFGHRERMQAVVMVAPLERVAAAPVCVEAGRARDEETQPRAVCVVLPLQPSLPLAPLVQLVQDHQG